MDSGWAVVITRHGFEETAAARLREAGYRTYLPMARHVLTGHRKRGRGEVVLRPMLSRIVFAWLDPKQEIVAEEFHYRLKHWRVPWGKRSRAFVSDAAIEILRDAERKEGEQAAAPAKRSTVGDTVSTKKHSAALSGVVVELRGADRLIIETLAGRRIEISEQDVVSA